MKPQATQQWRPKIKTHCVPDAEPVESKAKATELLTEVVEEVTAEKSDNKISVSVEVNEMVIQSIKRKRGKVKQKIEAETKTSLSLSKKKSGCYVVVKGSSDDAVEQAKRRLQDLLEKADTKAAGTRGDNGKEKVQDTVFVAVETTGWKPKALQWKPKSEIKMIHTSAGDNKWDKIKDQLFSNKETEDVERIAGSLQVDKKLLRLIKGHKNEVKERIEKATKTTIRIGTPVVVEGASEESVREALEEIQAIIEEGVNDSKFGYSHFISLPLNVYPTLVKRLEDFQENVLTSLGIPLTEEKPASHAAESSKETVEQTSAMIDNGSQVNVSVESTAEAEAAAVEGITEQAVLASLDIVTKEQEEGIEDALFREHVVVSLGIHSEEDHMDSTSKEESKVKEGLVQSMTSDEQIVEKDRQAVSVGVHEIHVTRQEEQETSLAENNDKEVGNLANEQQDTGTEDDGTEVELVKEGTELKDDEEVNELKDDEEADIVATEESKEYDALPEVSLVAKKKVPAGSGVEKSIFIRPSRFHLTVLMLKLWNEERVEKAREVLQNCLPDVNAALDGKPVSISLKGLEIMKGSPKNTRVLYAKVAEPDGGDRLTRACKVIIDAFVESGLVLGKDSEQALKLHATVMNTSHRKSKSRYKNRGFDATDILEKYGEENWGDYQITEAHLSERFKYDDNDYYHCCGSISFPGNETVNEEISNAATVEQHESEEEDEFRTEG